MQRRAGSVPQRHFQAGAAALPPGVRDPRRMSRSHLPFPVCLVAKQATTDVPTPIPDHGEKVVESAALSLLRWTTRSQPSRKRRRHCLMHRSFAACPPHLEHEEKVDGRTTALTLQHGR